MTTEFAGKHIVITGGSGALGRMVTGAFLDRGAVCHVPEPTASLPAGVAWAEHENAHISGGVNITSEDAVVAYYASLPPIWASVHLVGGFAMAPVVDTSLDDLRRMMSLNLESCFLCCREAIKAMRGHGGGRIVNVAARPALQPVGGMLAYTASKAAVASMTQTLAAELRDEDILVNAVVPSLFDTPANRASMPKADHDTWPKPEDIAQAIAFLASPHNRLTSGALVPVYGRA